MPPITSRSDQKTFKKAAQIAGIVCDQVMALAQPGVSTQALEDAANEYLAKHRATAPFKQFDGEDGLCFGFAICTSINAEIVNGIPSPSKVLEDGDVLKVAIGSDYRGFCGKAARTKVVGTAKQPEHQALIESTRSVFEVLKTLQRDQWTVWDITQTIMSVANDSGLAIVHQSGGYGIGSQLHQDVMVLNSATEKEADSLKRMVLKPGQGFVPMPMFITRHEASETGQWTVADDGWMQLLDSGAVCSHWAETCWINPHGQFEILTTQLA